MKISLWIISFIISTNLFAYSLTADEQKKYGGEYLKLENGITHYEYFKGTSEKTFVFVHGFSVPMFVWDPVFLKLKAEGHSVLRFDLFGRGGSDRPDVKYNMDLYHSQIQGLIKHLGIHSFHLFGLSMGGGIVVSYANKFPQQIKKLILVDPIGVPLNHPARTLAKIPVLSDIVMKLFDKFLFARGLRKNFFDQSHYDGFYKQAIKQFDFPGVGNALISSLRNMPFDGMEGEYKNLQDKSFPILLVWGDKDIVTPYENHKKVMEWVPRINFVPIQGAGHTPHYEKPDFTYSKIKAFLNLENQAAP